MHALRFVPLGLFALAGCVYDPDYRPYYGPGYSRYYAAPGYYYGPPVVGSFSFGYVDGPSRRFGHHHWRDFRHHHRWHGHHFRGRRH
jgi:hypothetical protein